MKDLFQYQSEKDITYAPLADRMRPRSVEEFVGQKRLVGEGKMLRQAIEADAVPSLVFWGPPGSGKTTLATIIARETKSRFVLLSGVESGVKDLRKVLEEAESQRKFHGQRTILFIDEIHRWNKAQQDALLPYVERGAVTLIGATTENPSFEIISPLLSRSRVFVLEQLGEDDLATIVQRALSDAERGLGAMKLTLKAKALEALLQYANGDARKALGGLEVVASFARMKKKKTIDEHLLAEALQHRAILYDKSGEEHYNIISAFIKSLRGSDPDAALYYLARMIEAGEDPLFIARRMVVFASEDISSADNGALLLAVATFEATHMIGLPEARINLAHCVTYLATAPKSNASYAGLEEAVADVRETLNLPVPLHLCNAPTKLMKELGYHKGYKYTHDHPEEYQQFLPDKLKDRVYYRPKSAKELERLRGIIEKREKGLTH